MKTLVILLMLMAAVLSLTSCGAFSNMSDDEAYKFGYNTGVWIRGGGSDEYIR